jgi:hypothetical protein
MAETTKRTQLDRDMELTRSLRAEINNIFYIARKDFWTHEQILEARTRRVFEHPKYRRLPDYRQYFLMGAFEALMQDLYYSAVEWRVMLDGKLIPGREVPDGRWSDVSGDEGAHVWAAAPDHRFS